MNRFTGVSAIAIMAISSPAFAGKEVRYEDAPDWVQVIDIDQGEAVDGPSKVLLDTQYRLENATVHTYRDNIVRIDNARALTRQGTLKMTWAPDKGDLFIHRLEILRGDEVIDLVAEGVEFEVLRRERNLERRLLDGRLTATLAVPKLQEGDMLRVAHSITVDDQALGDEMQALQYLQTDPFRVGTSRVLMSWPTGSGITYQAGPNVDLPEIETAGGYDYLSLDLPLAKREKFPRDAPSRFKRPPILRAGSFDSWQELSRVMEPHFTEAAQLADDGDVAGEVASIMAKTDDPMKRTEMAVRVVQDQVSYLMNGLDGGNYLPQSAKETWEKRYGDCKAKSVLLLAMLRQMEIDSDVVLVSTRGGDAARVDLPLPASFNHMIVRATIDGTDYWLDGTSTATRLSNMDTVPPFHYALPLTPEGTGLVPMTDRPLSSPNMVFAMEVDHSAGVDLPALQTMTIQTFGAAGARIKTIVDEGDPEAEKQWRRRTSRSSLGSGQMSTVNFAYDDELAMGTVTVAGVVDPMFKYDKGELSLKATAISRKRSFSPNRARPKWKDIPVVTHGPRHNVMDATIELPGNMDGYTLDGEAALDQSYANTRVVRNASLVEGKFAFEVKEWNGLGEIAPADIPAQRRAATKLTKSDLKLEAPRGSVRRWERNRETLARLTAGAKVHYDLAVGKADPDDFSALQTRAKFFGRIFDYENAAADLTKVIDEEPTERTLLRRARLYESLGRIDEAVDDVQLAYDLSSKNSAAYFQARLLRQSGRADEALALLESLPVSDDEMSGYVSEQAYATANAGDVEAGLAMLVDQLVEEPDDAELLNDSCWYRGIHNVSLDDALAICTRAIERKGSPAAALDSRAMSHYRLGNFDDALADLDAALKINPELSASRFMRGIILQEQGDEQGGELIEQALRQSPELAPRFKLYGIEPKS